MGDLDKWIKDMTTLCGCCTQFAPQECFKLMYQERLYYWSLTQAEQSKYLCDLWTRTWNRQQMKFNYLMGQWPVCESCVTLILCQEKSRRYVSMQKQVVDSGFTIKQFESRHKSRVRLCPKTDYFCAYLQTLYDVTYEISPI